MNARDRLKWALRDPSALCLCGEQGCPTADTLIDDFAHELAERIRSVREVDSLFFRSSSGGTVGPLGAVERAADLIDPHTAPDSVPDTCGPDCRCDPNKL